MGTPLISLDDLRSNLPIRDGNDQFDDKLSLIIKAVSLQVEGFCRISFAKKSYRELHHVQAGARVELDLFTDSSSSTNTVVTSGNVYTTIPDGAPFRLFNGPLPIDDTVPVRVFYDPRHAFTPDTEIDQCRIVVLPDTGYVYVDYAMIRSRDSVLITYDAGYDADGDPATLSDSLPEDVKLAVLTQCVYVFQRTDAENVGKQFDDGKVSLRYIGNVGGLLPEVSIALGQYRRLLRGRG